MAKKPFFSIIIPALNEEKYLPKLLTDLSSQSYRDFEVIVVDGGSRDKTVALAKTFASKLPKLTILTSSRAHVCTQRNLGAKHARADILLFSDADNSLPPYFLQGVKYRLEQHACDISAFWFHPDQKNEPYSTIANAINLFFELQQFNPKYILEALVVIKKSVFLEIGGFDESRNYSEGKSLIQKIITRGYTYKLHRDPIVTYSFRRFRRDGVVKLATNVAKMELSELLGPDYHAKQAKKLYPMLGGSLFNKTRKSKNKFIKNIQKLLKDL